MSHSVPPCRPAMARTRPRSGFDCKPKWRSLVKEYNTIELSLIPAAYLDGVLPPLYENTLHGLAKSESNRATITTSSLLGLVKTLRDLHGSALLTETSTDEILSSRGISERIGTLAMGLPFSSLILPTSHSLQGRPDSIGQSTIMV
jgi:hypothetical protein